MGKAIPWGPLTIPPYSIMPIGKPGQLKAKGPGEVLKLKQNIVMAILNACNQILLLLLYYGTTRPLWTAVLCRLLML